MKTTARRWIGLGASAVILLLVFYEFGRSPEWQRFRWSQFWSTVLHARPGSLILAVIATTATYLVRALRWKFFLDPIKKASLWISFKGQILGFSSIYLVGRAGEFVRPAYIARKERVPFTSMAAVWLLERVFDAGFLFLLFAAALSLAHINPLSGRGGSLFATLHKAGRVMLVTMVFMVGGLVVFRLRAEQLTACLSEFFRFLPGRGRSYVEHFLRSFADGLEVIRSWKEFLASLAATALLWIINTTAYWLLFRSLGGGLEQLPWMASALVMIFAGLGLVVQFPGIGGGYQVGAILALTQVFSVRPEVATSAGILIWILMSMPCMAMGVGLLIHEGLTLKKLQEIAEHERESTLEKA